MQSQITSTTAILFIVSTRVQLVSDLANIYSRIICGARAWYDMTWHARRGSRGTCVQVRSNTLSISPCYSHLIALLCHFNSMMLFIDHPLSVAFIASPPVRAFHHHAHQNTQ